MRMNSWRRMAIRSVIWAALLFVIPPACLACVMLMLVSSGLTISNMTAAARREGGDDYATRQSLLAIASLPFFLAGVVLVPLAVESDINKWRKAQSRKPVHVTIPL